MPSLPPAFGNTTSTQSLAEGKIGIMNSFPRPEFHQISNILKSPQENTVSTYYRKLTIVAESCNHEVPNLKLSEPFILTYIIGSSHRTPCLWQHKFRYCYITFFNTFLNSYKTKPNIFAFSTPNRSILFKDLWIMCFYKQQDGNSHLLSICRPLGKDVKVSQAVLKYYNKKDEIPLQYHM